MSGGEPGRGTPDLISVVMPIRNGEAHLGDQLGALAAQTRAGPWELVAVDNGCTDRSIAIVESWRGRLPALTVVDARARRGLNHARNAGAAAARGDFLAFCDADDVAAPSWLEGLAAAAPHGDIVGGRVDVERLNDPVRQAWHPYDPRPSLPSSYDFLPYSSGGNCGIWADVAGAIAWDESFRFGASDIDFSWRAQLSGYQLGFAPEALMHVRHRTRLRSIVKQYFQYGLSEPHLFRRYRRHGMSRASGEAGATWRWLARSPGLLLEETGRGRWLKLAASRFGRVCGSVRWRVLYL